MSEELLQRGLINNPEKIGQWDFYNKRKPSNERNDIVILFFIYFTNPSLLLLDFTNNK